MEAIIREIESALQQRFYYLGIATTLTLPDICAALAAPAGSTAGRNQASYEAWYNANLAAKYPTLTASDCYRLRCGVSHQGRFGHPRMQYARALFTVPNAQRNVFHNNIINDALNLDTIIFCSDVIQSIRDWLVANRENATVQANLSHVVQFRPQGLAPYMVGMPLIA
jgi:hypothetical protein